MKFPTFRFGSLGRAFLFPSYTYFFRAETQSRGCGSGIIHLYPLRRPLPQQAEATEETDLGEDAELHPAPEWLCDHNATRDQTESPSGQRAVIPGNQRRLGGGRTSSYNTAIIIEPPPPPENGALGTSCHPRTVSVAGPLFCTALPITSEAPSPTVTRTVSFFGEVHRTCRRASFPLFTLPRGCGAGAVGRLWRRVTDLDRSKDPSTSVSLLPVLRKDPGGESEPRGRPASPECSGEGGPYCQDALLGL